MQRARMLGNYAQHLAQKNNVPDSEITTLLDCSANELHSFYKGRSFLTFEQISALARLLKTTVEKLLEGDEEQYNETVVQCMNNFNNPENREKILDLIDDYLDLKELVEEE